MARTTPSLRTSRFPAGGELLLVNFDPAVDVATLASFRSRYNVNASVPLYGPYSGHLANGGESLALYKPDPPQLPPHPDAGFVPYVLVEQVDYANGAPWPTGAGGPGCFAPRSLSSVYGNDPANWFVSAPNPGRDNTSNPEDTNGDGLPDTWQIQYLGSIDLPQSAPGADPDGDGFSNLQSTRPEPIRQTPPAI